MPNILKASALRDQLQSWFTRHKYLLTKYKHRSVELGVRIYNELLSQPEQLPATNILTRRSQWPRGLRRRSSAARPLRLWVRIPPGSGMFVCCECCVLSGRGLCDVLITRPEESSRLWRVVVCDLETSNEEAKARYGVVENTTNRVVTSRKQTTNNILTQWPSYESYKNYSV